MSPSRPEIRHQLTKRRDLDELVVLRRRSGGRHAEQIEGVVLDVDRWVLVSAVTDVADPDGFEVVRRRDVRRVRRMRPGFRRFQARVMDANGLRPAPRPAQDVPLTNIRAILGTLADARALVALHIEAEDPDVMFPGYLVRLGKRKVRLAFVRTDGTWEQGTRRFTYDEITRVTFGSRYLSAFATYAEPFEAEPAAAEATSTAAKSAA